MSKLAVRYRPAVFSDVVGHGAAVSVLETAALRGDVNAVLLCGRSGVGKTTLLRVYARSLLCEQERPCSDAEAMCDSCRLMLSGTHPDYQERDASTSGGVASVRELSAESLAVPLRGSKRFYLLDEAHAVTRDGFNVLLKLLEEPPAHVRFGFATTNPDKIPPTIIGRCLVLSLRPVPSALVEQRVRGVAQAEKLTVSDDVVAEIVRLSFGQVRDAVKLLEVVSLLDNPTPATVRELEGLSAAVAEPDFLDALSTGKKDSLIVYLNQFAEMAIDVPKFVRNLVALADGIADERLRAGVSDEQTQYWLALLRSLASLLSEMRSAPGAELALLRAWCL